MNVSTEFVVWKSHTAKTNSVSVMEKPDGLSCSEAKTLSFEDEELQDIIGRREKSNNPDVIGPDEEDNNNTSRPWHGHDIYGHRYRGQGHYKGHNDERRSLDRILKSEFERREIDVSKYTFSNIQIDEIKRLTKDTKIIVKEGKIDLQGLTANVNEAAVAIYKYLHDVKDKESAKIVQKYVKWQYEDLPYKWTTFREDVNLQMENAHQARKDSCTVKDKSGTEYVIDFKKMEEHEKNHSRKKYKIRGVREGASSIELPAKWVPMKNNQTVVAITLKPGDNEYKQVLAKLYASSQGSVSVSEVEFVFDNYTSFN